MLPGHLSTFGRLWCDDRIGLVVEKRKVAVAVSLVSLVLGTMGAGLYLKHYFVVFAFGVWVSGEILLRWVIPQRALRKGRLSHLSDLLSLYKRSDAASETLLREKISDLRVEGALTEEEYRWIERLKELVELRALAFGKALDGKRGLRQAFAYVSDVRDIDQPSEEVHRELIKETFTLQDVTESAILVVADLYWKLYETCMGEYADLTRIACRLYQDIFGKQFEEAASRVRLEGLMDSMQRDSGLPFLLLNLIRRNNLDWARHWAQLVLTKDIDVDEEIRSVLYWITELHWFTQEKKTLISDHEETIRYLYHLCFTQPERAGFLEIDSQFFSQFETVNELAREGFLFKETLLEKVLWLWRVYEGLFDGTLRSVLRR